MLDLNIYRFTTYRGIHPRLSQGFEYLFWEISPTGWLILHLPTYLVPTAQAGPPNSQDKTEQNIATDGTNSFVVASNLVSNLALQ